MAATQVGMAGIMIEDQVAPKRCGHTKGKTVVGREEAYSRVRAACDARCVLRFLCTTGDSRSVESIRYVRFGYRACCCSVEPSFPGKGLVVP